MSSCRRKTEHFFFNLINIKIIIIEGAFSFSINTTAIVHKITV
jgi:hypothetical protein